MRRAVSLSFLGLLVLLALTRYPVPIYRDHTFLHFPVWEVAAKSEGFFFPLSNPYLNHGNSGEAWPRGSTGVARCG